jgi:predicted glycosyltransferase involved in capsule biosynthesis
LFCQLKKGFQVLNLKRFIFYLTEQHTKEVVESQALTLKAPDFVLQNLTGGGSLAIEKQAYFEIGGFDEGFVGWGGEDVEFWDRAQVLKLYNYGHIPLVHLWHAPQPEKNSEKDSEAMRRLQEVLKVPVSERITRLRKELAC